jgi:hypothetical protein
MSHYPQLKAEQVGTRMCLCVILPLGDFNLVISAGFRGIHSHYNPVHMASHQMPSRIAQDDNRYCALREILLKAHVFISC